MLNKNIYDMIKKSNEVTDDTYLVTNGSLLNKENFDKLIDSEVRTIRISLQGLNEEDYYNTCKYKINFESFLHNIEYLYKNKKSITKLYLKMPNISVDTDEKKELFYKLFEDKCDFLLIENIQNYYNEVDYSNIKLSEKNMLGNEMKDVLVCPQPFFGLNIGKDGKVFPCGNYTDTFIGNVKDESLYDIWNGEKLKTLRLDLLTKNIQNMNICSTCNIAKILYNKYDYLDDSIEDLLSKYK